MSGLQPSSVIGRSPGVHTVELDGEAVLLHEPTARVHHLNASASLIWACLDGVTALGVLSADVAAELGLETDRVLAEAVAVVEDLMAAGLAVVTPG